MNYLDRFNNYVDTIKKHTESMFPIESRKKRLEVSNVRVVDTDMERAHRWPEFQKAKETDRSFLGRVVGDVKLVDKSTGAVIDHKKDYTINAFPHVTALGSYVVNGKDLQVVNQLRRRPGAYPVVASDNNTVTKITAAGLNHDAILDRETGQLLLKVKSSHLKLVPLLQEMGIPREELEAHLGKELVQKNQVKPGARSELLKFYQLNRRVAPPSDENERRTSILNFLASKRVDPDVTQDTLGEKHEHVSPKLYLHAAKAALDVAKGLRQPADMESLVYKSVHSIEDYVDESLKEAYPHLKRRLAYLMDRKKDLKSILNVDHMSRPIINRFVASEFTRFSDQTNPLDVIGTMHTVTSMGEGGIQSEHAITDALRNVHNSHFGFLDPVHTPEGPGIGVIGHLAFGVNKVGNVLMRTVYDTHTGKMVQASPVDIARGGIAFADQYKTSRAGKREPVSAKITAITPSGKIERVHHSKIRYVLASPTDAFSLTTNAIPFLHANSANRMLMADRHMEQAVPLVDREVPLVQADIHGKGYDAVIGASMTRTAEQAGRVKSVRSDHLQIVYDDEPKKVHRVYYTPAYPLNAGTVMRLTPAVKQGQRLKPGMPLFDTNYTKDGALALGKTLVTALMPWRGYSYEDGIVISDVAARKLASEHMTEHKVEKEPGVTIGFDKLYAAFPAERANSSTHRMPQVGDILKPGQIVIPAIREVSISPDTDYAKVHKALRQPYMNASIYWEGVADGKVAKVVNHSGVVKVYVESVEPLVIGDKLSSRAGSKGIVTHIIPADQMPRTKDGKLIDVLFNPYGVPGRVNPTFLFENAASKIARKTGKPYLYRAFDTSESVAERLQNELKKHGLSDTEEVVDPTHNKVHKDVMVGENYWLKLKHQVKKKWAARSHEGPYTVDERPVRGGHESAQGIGPLDLYALLSNGYTKFLSDVTNIKSNKNTDFWSAYQLGVPPPPPKRPFILDKFETYLQGAGINIHRQGDTLKASPFTDQDIRKRSNGPISSPQVFRISKTGLHPERDGLFDPELTGGHGGTHWNHIELAERVMNPLYEQPVKAITGLATKDLDEILAGRKFIDNKTGGEAIAHLLKSIDVKKELQDTSNALKKAPASKRDPLLRKLRYLSALDRLGMTPVEAYTNKAIPVVPAKFRPIYDLPDGSLNVSDVNHGYREVMLINQELANLKKHGVADEHLAKLREGLYKAYSGLIGLTEPVTRSGHFRGFISQIAGSQNKHGLYQAKVVMRRQDLSGRSAIINGPHFGIDEVGIPERLARELYKPYLVRALVNLAGLKPVDARKEVETGSERVNSLLDDEMKRRPVLLNRAPALHKFSEVALIPKRVPGDAIQLNPLVFGGLNADVDGDTVGVHVPHTEAAREELLRNLPSRNIMSPKSGDVQHSVSKEATLGLYMMTTPHKNEAVVSVKNPVEAVTLYNENKIDLNTPLRVADRSGTWTVGHFLVNAELPDQYKLRQPTSITGKQYKTILNQLVNSHPDQAGRVISRLKDLGFDAVTRLGFSVNLKSLTEHNAERDKVAREVEKIMQTDPEGAVRHAEKRLEEILDKHVTEENPFALMSYKSGASGKHRINVRQLILAPGGVTDLKGRIVPIPLMRSYADGLTLPQYWATMPGARKGIADRAVSTQDTGAFNKELVNTTIGVRVTDKDCGTRQGIMLPADHPDLPGRWIASGPHAGQLITAELAAQLRRENKPVMVRSPMTCALVEGVCQHCAGLNEAGRVHPVGFHIGAYAGTTITEPITQMVLRAFHSQGAVGAGEVGYKRIRQIFTMPQNIRGKATLSRETGTVSEIIPTDRGGWEVVVDSIRHFVPAELELAVKVGDHVKRGDQLSRHGVLKIQEVAELRGHEAARDQLIKDLDSEMSAAGQNIRRRIYEVAMRPLINRVEVLDPGDAAKQGVVAGDVMNANYVKQLNEKLKHPIVFKPIVMSIREVPFVGEDFIGPLMYQRLPRTLREAPAIGGTTHLKGPKAHPIVEYAWGNIG